MKLSVVIPVFNEEENLPPLHQQLTAAVPGHVDDYEVIFVNDGSTDRSLALLQELCKQDPHVRYLSFSRNFGHEIASTAGLDAASGDAVILMDADLQDPPALIVDLLTRWKAGADVVYARRRHRAGESFFKRTSAHLFYRLLCKVADVRIPRDTGDFRLMDRRVVEQLRACRENPRFMRGLVAWVGFRQDEVMYDRPHRHAGRTKYNLFKLVRLSWEAICAFSLVPLRFVMWLGAVVTALSLALTVIVAIQKLLLHLEIPGYALLACGIFFLGGIQLIMLGIIAQYLGLTFKAAQNRPLYIIDQRGGWETDHERSALPGNV
ncbi:MAG TPA: glycosyltransferase family 2 protein [Phycisphaerae bacterium]|nr:glycosyltransferase family 2 protein [Phycisphaerae bacterium]